MWKKSTKIKSIYSKLSNNRLLNNKLAYTIMWLIFIISLSSTIYDLNVHNWTYRFIKEYARIIHIEDYVYYWLVISSVYWWLIIISKIKKLVWLSKAIYSNKILSAYIIISIISFVLIESKTKILYIITPVVIYFVYKMYKHISDTKEKSKNLLIIDSRYIFLIALVLLIYTPIYIYLWNKELAENLSIYAYYLLLIWVIYEIVSSKFSR